jgi:hypothetical protein
MSTRDFFEELTFWVMATIGILFVFIPTKAFLKILSAKVGQPGLSEALAS